MQASDIKDNQGIAFFFNNYNVIINNHTISEYFPLLPTECASTTNP